MGRLERCGTCGLFLTAHFCCKCGYVFCERCIVKHAKSHMDSRKLHKLAMSQDKILRTIR